MMISKHASVRCQQRAIPNMMIDLLYKFGSAQKSGSGAETIYFDKAARRRLRSYAGPLAAKLEEHLNCFIVISDNETVVTTGHLTRRVKNG